ncbi:ThiF family adenylyltransferase [Chitinophaga horti]|uniref:ThiF family adenylyltransferase n=1 Tax=Chitinophaga horti TaxID=2920382 RepID=A0ABY6IXA3_9BACT|nr:ThiF family adenylyltransferase [Chitinophaga horti]UYQ92014.1 ThiF family adenylyltransferase [Chitinophaga horti]
MALNEKELLRYKHSIAVPGLGLSMQEKIKNTRILVIGCGGLGATVLQYLSAAGVGVIGIADYGVLNEEDLSRTPLFQIQDIRKHKAKMASSRMWAFNPFTKHYPFLIQVKPENVQQVIREFDLVIDCSQNEPTHLVVNDGCILGGKPFVMAEVHNWTAWWAGFNIPQANGDFSASYRCVRKEVDEYRNFDAGALPFTHGAAATHIVNSVMRYLLEVPGLANLHSFDFLHQQYKTTETRADAGVVAETKERGLLTADEYGMTIEPDVED